MILITHLRKVYGENDQSVEALEDVSLEVRRGEIFGVVGPSGAGKSTLLRCVNLLERPTSGSVVVNGQNLTALNEAELRQARQRIGMIFQHFNLLSSRTVAQNVAFPLEITGVSREQREERVREMLALVGLSDKADAFPSQLSGGQKQRVGIARALATEPELLLSDEATSALDSANTTAILNLLKDLNQRLGITILLITHEMDVVKQVCDRVAFMRQGRIVECGTIPELVSKPGSLLGQALFAGNEFSTIPAGGTGAILTFIGDQADQPVLSSLIRKFDVNVNIIGGSIQPVRGGKIGRLHVEFNGPQIREALAYLKETGIRVEAQ